MKLLKPAIIAFGLLFLVAVIAAIELYFIKLPSVDMITKLLLIVLLTVNVVALLTLMFFVGKNLFMLYMERQHKVLGYKFRTRLMAIFVVLTLIPSAFLFIAASGLAANYINRILSPQMKAPFQKSIELARAFYDLERERVLNTARGVAAGKTTFLAGMSSHRYTAVPAGATEIVTDAFQGKEGTEVISKDTGDVIRSAVPDRSGEKGHGVVVVEMVLPKSISDKSEKIKDLYEDYLKVESFREPLRLNYILILGFLTLMMVFTGLWVSLKISRGITIPIQSLAMATEQVAAGNLEIQVDVKSKDEVGLLISSFNQMVRQLKESKSSLEKAYMESDTRRLYLENILENINSGVIFLDTNGKIFTINKAAYSILDLKQTGIIGSDYREFIATLKSEELNEMVRDMEGTRIKEISREVKVSVGGRTVTCRIYIAGLRDSQESRSLGMLVVFNDLTDVIKAQKAIAWQEVAQRMAHEIKNPLTPIKLSAERLVKKWLHQDEDFGSVLEKSTKTIIAEAESLRRLVDEFSKYGRLPEIRKELVNFYELADSVAALYKGFRDVEITLLLSEGIPPVNIDREQFKRVLINIMDNAIKAMDNRGRISISAETNGNNVKIDIADTGPGISNEEKEKLFIPYFSNRKGGTGLGLAIANKIVTDHGGQITVRDNRPSGSAFSVEIPIV